MDTSLHYTSVNHANCLVSTINKLRKGGQLCDVVISAGKTRIPAHRLVLAASSPYFVPLLNSAHPTENGISEIPLNNVDADSIEHIIEFCYTSSICVTEDNVWTLLPTATCLQMNEICTLCADFLRSLLSPATCMQTYVAAIHCGMTELALETQKLLKENLDKVFESEGFCTMSLEDILQALQSLPSSVLGHRDTVRAIRAWVQHDKESRQYHAAKLARIFPGLVSRLKEFLPEDLLSQPQKTEGAPTALSSHTLCKITTDCDPEVNGLDLSINTSSSSTRDNNVTEAFISDSPDTMTAPLCLICGEIFFNHKELTQHKNHSMEFLFKESGEILENGFPNSPESTDSREDENGMGRNESRLDQNVCQLCFKIFSDRKSLGKHLRTHSRNGFSCTVCFKRYSTRSHLLGHMRLHSGTHSPFACDFCRHPFSSYCALKVHMRGHKGTRPFTCPTCGQHFAKNIHLKRHISTHTGIKPHECELCGKHFSRSDHLKRHVQSIHAGQRPHACHICQKAFVRKYELNKHLQLHARSGSILSDASWDCMPLSGLNTSSPSLSLESGDSR